MLTLTRFARVALPAAAAAAAAVVVAASALAGPPAPVQPHISVTVSHTRCYAVNTSVPVHVSGVAPNSALSLDGSVVVRVHADAHGKAAARILTDTSAPGGRLGVRLLEVQGTETDGTSVTATDAFLEGTRAGCRGATR